VKRIIAVLAATLALAGCLPVTTTSPVGSTSGFRPDPALYGMWEGSTQTPDEHEVAYIAFLPGGDNGNATAIFVSTPVPVKSGDWASYAVKITALGRYHYLNAQALITDGKPAEGSEANDSFPVLYQLDAAGTLTLYLIDEDAAKAALKAGKIAGLVRAGTFGDVTLTAAPSDLDAYFSGPSGRALFTKPLIVMHRVK
jgi:hypothetical protein